MYLPDNPLNLLLGNYTSDAAASFQWNGGEGFLLMSAGFMDTGCEVFVTYTGFIPGLNYEVTKGIDPSKLAAVVLFKAPAGTVNVYAKTTGTGIAGLSVSLVTR